MAEEPHGWQGRPTDEEITENHPWETFGNREVVSSFNG